MTDDDSPADDLPQSRGGRLSRVRAAAVPPGRPRWKWLVIGLLLTFSIVVTAMFVATMAAALAQHHWARALDTTRDAVPAAVGWAAVLIVLLTPAHGRRQLLSEDSQAVAEKLRRAARDADSARRAGQRVQKLTDRLAVLIARLETPSGGNAHGTPAALSPQAHDDLPEGAAEAAPGTGARAEGTPSGGRAATAGISPGRHLARQVADTRARLEQARQWLESAQAALAVSQQEAAAARDELAHDEVPPPAERHGPTAGRVA